MRDDEKLEINGDSYILGVWYAEQPEKQNMTFWVYKNPKHSEKWIIKWIIRTYNPESLDPFDGKDHKKVRIFSAPIGANENDISSIIDLMMKTGEHFDYSYRDKIICKGGFKKLIELAKNSEWLNVKSDNIH